MICYSKGTVQLDPIKSLPPFLYSLYYSEVDTTEGQHFKSNSALAVTKKMVVLCVASSDIAALLLPGGRTAHSWFKIPLNTTSVSICNISKGIPLAE